MESNLLGVMVGVRNNISEFSPKIHQINTLLFASIRFQNMLIYWEAVGPHRFKFNTIIKFCGNHFYDHANTTLQHQNLRADHIEKLLKIASVVMGALLLGYVIIFVIPIYESYRTHNRAITPLAINLPFFEKDGRNEFIVNMSIQLTISFYSLCGNSMIELASSAINNAILLVPDLIRFNLMEFEEELQTNGITVRSWAQLRNSFVQLQDYHRLDNFYLSAASENSFFIVIGKHLFWFFWICSFLRYLRDVIIVNANKLLVCPFVWAFSMSLSIFNALSVGKYGCLGSAMVCYVELMVVYYMGNNVKETVMIDHSDCIFHIQTTLKFFISMVFVLLLCIE